MADPLDGGPTFPLRHRLFRMAWSLAWAGLASWTPAPLHRWRAMLLRAFGAHVDPTVHVYGSARIWYPPHLTMGAHSALGPGVDCYCMAPIVIGAHVVVSQRAMLCAGSHDSAHPRFPLITRPIAIGDRAWVAAEAFVGPGVVVGEGAVLGARGVAVRDLAPWTIYGGNPARMLKPRLWAGAPGNHAAPPS